MDEEDSDRNDCSDNENNDSYTDNNTDDNTNKNDKVSPSKLKVKEKNSAKNKYGKKMECGNFSGNNSNTKFKEKRRRHRTTKEQLATLEQIFRAGERLPGLSLRQKLAQQLNMTPRRVQVWFQNKRAKEKKSTGKIQEKHSLNSPPAVPLSPPTLSPIPVPSPTFTILTLSPSPLPLPSPSPCEVGKSMNFL